MARAEIYVEDDEDGNVSFAVRYIGGEPQVASNAHQIANACRRFLKANLTQVGTTKVTDGEGSTVIELPAGTDTAAATDAMVRENARPGEARPN